MLQIKLHPFYNMDGDIGDSSPSVEGTVETVSTETASVQGDPSSKETESSFARRLREHSEKEVRTAREAWEKEVSEKYKDYDTHKELSSYFQEINGMDAMTLRERVEMERLQARAERENVPTEVLKRLDELEAKAAKADQMEQQQQQVQKIQSFENGLKEFAKDKQLGDKPLDHMELWSFMHENGISKPEAAFKAMKADVLEKQLEEAEKNGMKKLLQAKSSIPNVTGNKAQGVVTSPAPKTFAEARQRAMQRMTQT